MLKTRAIKCGKKSCTKCPHGFYIYAQWKEQGKVKEKYLGKLGDPATESRIKELAKSRPDVIEKYQGILEKSSYRKPDKTAY